MIVYITQFIFEIVVNIYDQLNQKHRNNKITQHQYSKKMKKADTTDSITQSSIHINQAQHGKELPQQISSDMQFVFGFNVSTSQIVQLFQAIVHEMNFDLIQSQQNHATAIKHAKKSFMQVIDCFNWMTQGNVTAVKMSINNREKDSKRVCRIRGLVGSKKQVIQFIQKFKNKSAELMTTKLMYQQDDQIQMGEQQTNPFYLQSCAAYMFHKILSNEKYGIGSLLHSSINNFNSQYKDAKNSAVLLPLPMKKAVTIVEEVVTNLYKDFNYGRHQMQQIMPYCRISVEKYVFQKIYDTISAIYECKSEVIVQTYIKKKNKIMNSLTPLQIFKSIGLCQKLWIDSADNPQLSKPGTIFQTKAVKSYKKASRELQKIISTQSPRQKVKYTQIMYTCLKTIVYEQSSGNQQLFNMEDIIPMLIFILLITGIDKIKNQLDFMVDFIGFDPCDLESERRLLVNLSESFNYITRDWKIQ